MVRERGEKPEEEEEVNLVKRIRGGHETFVILDKERKTSSLPSYSYLYRDALLFIYVYISAYVLKGC